MGHKKSQSDEGEKVKKDKTKSDKPGKAKGAKTKAKAAAKAGAEMVEQPKLTQEDALAMAEAIVEMVNEGAEHPVAFFVSGSDPLGRELIQLQGGDAEDMNGVVPVVLDAAQVRRYAMLTVADELLWRRAPGAS
jgi:hypothetical protein